MNQEPTLNPAEMLLLAAVREMKSGVRARVTQVALTAAAQARLKSGLSLAAYSPKTAKKALQEPVAALA